ADAMSVALAWIIGVFAAIAATIFSTADSALLAFHASEASTVSNTAFAQRERLHRALSMARVLSYIASGVALAQALPLASMPLGLRVVVTGIAAAAVCVLAEGIGRAIGYRNPTSIYARLSPLVDGVAKTLAPAVALGGAIERTLNLLIP